IAQSGTVSFDGGAGNDTLSMEFTSATAGMTFDYNAFIAAGSLAGSTFTKVEGINIFRTAFNDTFKRIGPVRDGMVIGGGGIDTLIVDLSSSRATVNDNGYVIVSNGHSFQFCYNDVLEITQITGGAAADSLSGGPSNDQLNGGDGNDYL